MLTLATLGEKVDVEGAIESRGRGRKTPPLYRAETAARIWTPQGT